MTNVINSEIEALSDATLDEVAGGLDPHPSSHPSIVIS
jgi:hypothetical protein